MGLSFNVLAFLIENELVRKRIMSNLGTRNDY